MGLGTDNSGTGKEDLIILINQQYCLCSVDPGVLPILQCRYINTPSRVGAYVLFLFLHLDTTTEA